MNYLKYDNNLVKYCLVLFFGLILLGVYILIDLYGLKNLENVSGVWKIDSVLINKKRINFEDNVLFLRPIKDDLRIPGKENLRDRGKWKFWKDGFESRIEITGTKDGFFNDTYNVELEYMSSPLKMHLFSDNIDIYCQKQVLGKNNPVIELN